jgi:hypothetical protein
VRKTETPNEKLERPLHGRSYALFAHSALP